MGQQIDLLVLQVLLKSKFRTQYQAAKALNIQDYQLSLYLNGRRKIPEEIIKTIETLLEISRHNIIKNTNSTLGKPRRKHE